MVVVVAVVAIVAIVAIVPRVIMDYHQIVLLPVWTGKSHEH